MSFDWYLTHEEFEPFLTRHCSHQDDVLMVGCGNSKLSEEMCRAGNERIANDDISEPVIEKQCKDLGMEVARHGCNMHEIRGVQLRSGCGTRARSTH